MAAGRKFKPNRPVCAGLAIAAYNDDVRHPPRGSQRGPELSAFLTPYSPRYSSLTILALGNPQPRRLGTASALFQSAERLSLHLGGLIAFDFPVSHQSARPGLS